VGFSGLVVGGVEAMGEGRRKVWKGWCGEH